MSLILQGSETPPRPNTGKGTIYSYPQETERGQGALVLSQLKLGLSVALVEGWKSKQWLGLLGTKRRGMEPVSKGKKTISKLRHLKESQVFIALLS